MARYDSTKGIFVPDYLFDRLLNEDNGENLLALWIRYARQARMQNSDDTKSYDGFMRGQLRWGTTKFENSKRELKKLGLIETERNGGDWVTKVYGEIEEENPTDSPKTHPLKIGDIPENPPIENRGVIDNIVINNNIKDKKNIKEKKKEKIEWGEQTTVDGYILNKAIAAIYDVLIEEGVPRKQEVNNFVGPTAIKSLLKSPDFKRASEAVGDAILLIQSVARYGAKDGFWADKCNSLTGFARNFPTLYLQAKSKGAIKPKAKTLSQEDVSSLISGFLKNS